MRRKFKKDDFVTKSILPGFKEGEFHHLSDSDKGALLVLLARIQESAYRRGIQQGVTYAERFRNEFVALKQDAYYNRFNVRPDIAPPYHWDGAGKVLGRMSKRCINDAGFSSIQRLDMEHGRDLVRLGLYLMKGEE